MSYQDIYPEELDELRRKDGLIIIDTRDRHSFAQGHLPGAHLSSDDLLRGLIRQRRANPPVLIYCYHGNSSRDLAGLLAQLGLTRVYNLVGGWQAWIARQAQAA